MLSMPSESATEPKRAADSATARSRIRRAVSEADKSARRAAILTAADTQFRAAGFEKFSMEVLSRELEVARGTLYRYFSTREELLLNLYQRRQRQFVDALINATRVGIGDEDFLRLWYDLSLADPTLIALRLRLTNVIEHNVEQEVLVATKQAMSEDFNRLCAHLSGVLRLPQPQTDQLVVALLALLLGAAQADAAPEIDTSALPAETLRIMNCFASESVFLSNAELILSGLRQQRGRGQPTGLE